MAAAPASDAATREGRHCLRVGAVSIFFFSFHESRRRGADLGHFGLNRANSGRIGRYRRNEGFLRWIDLGQHKKNKK